MNQPKSMNAGDRHPTLSPTEEDVAGRRWVLVTAGSRRRASVEAVRSLAAGGYRPAATITGPSLAAASRYCERRVEVPSVTDPAYPGAIASELEKGRYLTVLPASDPAMLALRTPGWELLDKGELERRAAAAGLEMPPTELFESKAALLAATPRLPYPVVVKPTTRRHFPRRFRRPQDVDGALLDDGPLMVQPFLEEEMTEVTGVIWESRLVAASHHRCLRVWPSACGTVTAAVTTASDRGLEERLVALLEGYDGIFQAQFIGRYLLDVNPMVHTSIPLARAAGVNLAAIHCDLLRGVRVEPVRSTPGVFYRWLEGDLRSVSASFKKGSLGLWEAVRALRPQRGTAHSTESLRDPGPMAARVWHGALRGGL